MNRIEKMIKEKCPDGVRRLSLDSICTISIGEFVHKDLQDESYDYPVYNGGRTYTGFYQEYNNDENTIIVSARGANAGFVNFVSTKFWAGNSCYSLKPIDDRANIHYLFYILKFNEENLIESQQKGGGIPAISKKQMQSFEIPLPPLSIQQEIVEILDSFTALQQNLEDELKLRQKQYEHYREKLLTFEDGDVEWKKLGECCIVNRGVRVVKRELLAHALYPVFQNSLQPMGFLDKTNVPGDSVYVITAGSSSGSVGYQKNPFWAADDCVYIIPNEAIKAKYIWHYLNVKERIIKANVRQGAMPRLPRNILETFCIPVLPLDRQLQITQTLDHFESLISNLKTEIELRKKQYEYYREKLLTF